VRLKRSFIDLKNQYETNMNLINGDGNILISCAKQPPPSHLLQSVSKSSEYQQITEPNLNINEINLAATSSGAGQFQNNYAFNLRTDEMRSSKKLKRIVDFIY
jgi:mannose/fructose/N-acetylgalactosamine-specific phosphotransferase system component IIB